jgi:flavodoxin
MNPDGLSETGGIEMAKCLVVYYSRTGTTQALADAVAEQLACPAERLVDRKSRRGMLGFLRAGIDAARKRGTEIEPPQNAPGECDLVVIGTPVWAGTMSCAVRAYIAQHRGKFRNVGFFLTTGGSGIKGTFAQMEELSGLPPRAVLGVRTKDFRRHGCTEEIRRFVRELQS